MVDLLDNTLLRREWPDVTLALILNGGAARYAYEAGYMGDNSRSFDDMQRRSNVTDAARASGMSILDLHAFSKKIRERLLPRPVAQ